MPIWKQLIRLVMQYRYPRKFTKIVGYELAVPRAGASLWRKSRITRKGYMGSPSRKSKRWSLSFDAKEFWKVECED